MLVVMIGVRKLLDYVFSRRELKILDDIMPEMVKRQAADDMHSLEDGNGGEVRFIQRFFKCCVGEQPSKDIRSAPKS